MSQSMKWLKPMFPEQEYEAIVRVKEVYPEKSRVMYECLVEDPATGEQTITGEALLMNKKQYVW